MTPQQPHPQRCETCEKFPFESQNQCVIIRASREHAAHAWFFTSEMGCASHSSAGSQQRIEQVIKELVDLEAKSLSTCDTAFGYREGLKTAIALLRGGAK